MKKLDLNNYGVQEMNAGEMREVEGGSWHWVGSAIFGTFGAILGALIGGPVGAVAGAAIGAGFGGI